MIALTLLTNDVLENSCRFQKAINCSIQLDQLRAVFLRADLRVQRGDIE